MLVSKKALHPTGCGAFVAFIFLTFCSPPVLVSSIDIGCTGLVRVFLLIDYLFIKNSGKAKWVFLIKIEYCDFFLSAFDTLMRFAVFFLRVEWEGAFLCSRNALSLCFTAPRKEEAVNL